jgi:DNA replication protein DnaC
MKAKRIFTRKPAQVFEFWTFGELALMRMLWAANEFLGALAHPASRPYWLTFLGCSGIGKSYLMERIYEFARRMRHLTNHPTLLEGAAVRFCSWPEVLARLKDGQYWLLQELMDCNVLFLDDPFADWDPSGFGVAQLFRLLDGRKRKWTFITSNLTRQQIAEKDLRIISRLLRDNNEVIDAEAPDYALRPQSDVLTEPSKAVPATEAEYEAIVARYQRLETMLSEARNPHQTRHAVDYLINAVLEGEDDEEKWVWTVQE